MGITSYSSGCTRLTGTEMLTIWSSKSFGAPGECEVAKHYCLGASRRVGWDSATGTPCTCSVQWNSQLGSW